MSKIKLSLRLAWRGFVAGEYKVLLSALVLAVACATLLGVVSERIQGAVGQRSAQMAGGDLVVQGSQPVSKALKHSLTSAALRWSEQVRLNTMLAAGEELVLVNLHAVDANYPLLGQVEVETPAGVWRHEQPPTVGEIWLEQGLVERLNLSWGDKVMVGGLSLQFSARLVATPDQSGGFSSFAPKALVHLDSLAASPLLGALSRASWSVGITGTTTEIQTLRTQLPEFLEAGQRLVDLSESQPGLAKALLEGQQYLALASLVAILLAATAVALAAQRQFKRQTLQVALLRCLGVAQNQTQWLLLLQLLWLALVAGLLGGALGYLAHWGLIQLLSQAVPLTLAPASLKPLVAAFSLAGVLLLGCTLAPLLSLRQLSPLAVLQVRPWQLQTSSWLTYASAVGIVLLLGWWLVGNWRLTLFTVLGLAGSGALVAALGWLCLRWLAKSSTRWPWSLRQAVRRLERNPATTLLQLCTFTLAFTALVLVARGGSQLMQAWQQQLPSDLPNQFVLDIQAYEKTAFEQFLHEQQLDASRIYPILRARLVAINGQEASLAVPLEARDDNTLRRELNLTWSEQLPEDNQLSAGSWWPDLTAHPESLVPISLEEGMAQRLNLSLGSQLTFNLAGTQLPTYVASLRQVQWESFKPNFYVVFPPEALAQQAHTYMASFAVSEKQPNWARQLNQQFPGVVVLDVRTLLAQVQSLLHHLSLAVEYLLGFVLLAGLLVAWALLLASLDARQQEQTLLKVLGVARAQLLARQWLEFMLLGGLAGVLAVGLSELLYSLIASRFLGLAWHPAPVFWLAPPLLSALLLAGGARLALHKNLHRSPHRSWQQLN